MAEVLVNNNAFEFKLFFFTFNHQLFGIFYPTIFESWKWNSALNICIFFKIWLIHCSFTICPYSPPLSPENGSYTATQYLCSLSAKSTNSSITLGPLLPQPNYFSYTVSLTIISFFSPKWTGPATLPPRWDPQNQFSPFKATSLRDGNSCGRSRLPYVFFCVNHRLFLGNLWQFQIVLITLILLLFVNLLLLFQAGIPFNCAAMVFSLSDSSCILLWIVCPNND